MPFVPDSRQRPAVTRAGHAALSMSLRTEKPGHCASQGYTPHEAQGLLELLPAAMASPCLPSHLLQHCRSQELVFCS